MQYIEPLPELQPQIVFSEFEFVAEGTHSFVYKVLASDESRRDVRCLKLFRKDWMTPFNLETTAYAFLQDANLKDYIPKVYGQGKRTVSEWGLENIAGDKEGEYYGIIMEWIEGAERLSETNVTVGGAIALVNGLAQIHNAGVLHFDTFPRNMLVVPGTERAVWIDFSCAQSGEEYMSLSFLSKGLERHLPLHISANARFTSARR